MTVQTASVTQGNPDDGNLLAIVTLGELLDDLMEQRKANGNRIAALERTVGTAFPYLIELQAGLKALEHETNLELVRAWRKHPLAEWAKEIRGLGEKSIARLVALIGDPGSRENPSQLRQFCGHGDPNRSRPPKGATQAQVLACGSPKAKAAVWRIATAFVKSGDNPYRDVYDAARERYAERTHEGACVRCGPSGKPALAGSPWSLGHQHAAALRLVGKTFLLDLWKAARAGQGSGDAHPPLARAGHASNETHCTNARAGYPTDADHSSSARAGHGSNDHSIQRSPARAKL